MTASAASCDPSVRQWCPRYSVPTVPLNTPEHRLAFLSAMASASHISSVSDPVEIAYLCDDGLVFRSAAGSWVIVDLLEHTAGLMRKELSFKDQKVLIETYYNGHPHRFALTTHKGKIPTRADQLDVEAEFVTRRAVSDEAEFVTRCAVLEQLRNKLRNRRCVACGNVEAASKCVMCWEIGKRVNYCNHACQRTHWRVHKASCGRLLEGDITDSEAV